MTAARHRAFIAPRLLGSFVALASFPVYIAVRGVPSALEIGVFSWLVAPILIVYYLSRTGRYESAHILSSLSLTVLASAVALATGGIGSFAVVWLVVVPLEAALSASRRVVATAAGFALIAACCAVRAWRYRDASPDRAARGGAQRAGRNWRHLRDAICHRSCARRRVVLSHKFMAAAFRGRTLSLARKQYDRRRGSFRARRLSIVRVADSRIAYWRAGKRAIGRLPF